jgi:hypothetical protein
MNYIVLMKSDKQSAVIIKNITASGISLTVKDHEYFLDFEHFSFFKNQKLGPIFNVQLIHEHHLYWHELDIDLEIDNLEHPEKYPLDFSNNSHRTASQRLAKLGASQPGLKTIPRRRIEDY